VTIYDVQNAQKTPIWKQRIIECRSSGMSVKEWCKEHGLDFTTYYRWERKILTSIIPAEDVPGLPSPNLPSVPAPQNAVVKVELAAEPEDETTIRFSVNGYNFCVPANVSTTFLSRLLEATKHAG
jgi:transposase-like protein